MTNYRLLHANTYPFIDSGRGSLLLLLIRPLGFLGRLSFSINGGGGSGGSGSFLLLCGLSNPSRTSPGGFLLRRICSFSTLALGGGALFGRLDKGSIGSFTLALTLALTLTLTLALTLALILTLALALALTLFGLAIVSRCWLGSAALPGLLGLGRFLGFIPGFRFSFLLGHGASTLLALRGGLLRSGLLGLRRLLGFSSVRLRCSFLLGFSASTLLARSRLLRSGLLRGLILISLALNAQVRRE